MKFEIFAGPSLKISGGYYEISGGLSFTRAIAQRALLRVVTPRPFYLHIRCIQMFCSKGSMRYCSALLLIKAGCLAVDRLTETS